MFWPLEITLLLLMVIAGFIALEAPHLLTAIIGLGVFSLLAALTYSEMGAPDVAFTEAVVGAGVTSIYLIIALFHLRKESGS